MTRIVAGSARGRRLSVPAGRSIRPTSDRAREALFSTLTSLVDLAGGTVLDLFSGTGAVGLEALSRGAAHVVLVESDPAAIGVIGANVAAVGLAGAQVVRSRVEAFLDAPDAHDRFDVIFADPPYDLDDAALRADVAAAAGWLRPGGVVVVERPSHRGPWSWPAGIATVKQKRYGAGTLWYGRRS